ncbi:MAG: outer membrane lipoprotein-sorting protein [bacterium]
MKHGTILAGGGAGPWSIRFLLKTLRAAAPRSVRVALFSAVLILGTVSGDVPVCASPASEQQDQTSRVREILETIDRMWRGRSSEGEMEMEVATSHWSRTLRMDAYTEGMERSLVRITYPAKEEGVATLKVGNDLWNYLPKINRVTRVPASMMLGSWMGSHFTNDDLVKESRYADDYETTITFEGDRDGQKILELTLEPKPEAPVVWGKIVAAVRADDYIPLQMDYFNESGKEVRTLTFSKVQDMGGRRIPTELVMRPVDKPNESTRVTYLNLTFDVRLDPELFSLRALQKRP